MDKTDGESKDDGTLPNLFEENFKELKKWVDVKCPKYGILLVTNEKRNQRLGTALKVFSSPKSCVDCCHGYSLFNSLISNLKGLIVIKFLSNRIISYYYFLINHMTPVTT